MIDFCAGSVEQKAQEIRDNLMMMKGIVRVENHKALEELINQTYEMVKEVQEASAAEMIC